jgi:hypothetical protein
MEKRSCFIFDDLRIFIFLSKFHLFYICSFYSMGGIMATQYTHEYPHRVSHLILASVAGMPAAPREIPKLGVFVENIMAKLWVCAS